jgi:hypothetical protein
MIPSKNPYSPVIKPILASILAWVLQLASTFVSKIKDPFLANQLSILFSLSTSSIQALADTDPEDKDQIRQLVFQTVSGTAFQDEWRDFIIQNMNIDPEKQPLREVMAKLIGLGFGAAEISLDDNKNNSAQFQSLLSSELTSGEMSVFLANIVQVWRPDLTDQQLEPLIQLLMSTLDQLIQDGSGPGIS